MAYLLIYNVSILQCLNVTCYNQIGSHPFRRANTCYIKKIDRPLESNEHMIFLQSYGSPEKIKTLDITTSSDETGIDRIPIEVFTWFTHLESLRINSKVAAISAADLELSTNLTELVISDRLQSIARGIFPLDNKLIFLSLESNHISTIEDYTFERLNRLFSLKLQKNQLQEIRQHTFSGLGVLHVLNLNQNKIRVIENGAFDGLNHLQFLHLQQNQLENLYDSVFHGLTRLIDISLSENRIHVINKSLQFLNNIKKIDLNHNQITDLDLNEFAKFQSLIDLRLIDSGFTFNKTHLNNKGIATTSTLEYLYLDNNNLSNPLDFQDLSMFSELRELSLDDNLYGDFDLGGKRLKQIFPKLQFISLEGNNIDENILNSITDDLNHQPGTINSM